MPADPLPAPRVLLASELGAGRGHVVKLARVAGALGPGLPLVAALPGLRHAADLRSMGARVIRCPRLRVTSPAGNATWACYLGAVLNEATAVRRSLGFWRDLIVAEDISILVADYAPLALWAAQTLRAEGWDIRIIAVGTGYGVPPDGLERLPRLVPGYDRVVHPEAGTLALLNQVAEGMGIAPLPRLAALGRADRALVATFPFLDPYGRPAAALCPPLVDLSHGLAEGDELFVYFSRDEPAGPDLAEALTRLPLPRRGYLPGADATVKARLRAAGMIVEEAPIPAALIARRSRMVLHAAPHGTLCMAALAGLPQAGLPGHMEQMTHATRAAAAGILRLIPPGKATAAGIMALVTQVYDDAAMRGRARDLALELRAGFPADPMADLARRLAPQVRAARGFVML
jgi:hypothetical protein